MSRQRHFDNLTFLQGLKADRAERAPIREERLRTTAGLLGSAGITLSAWRGKSGRRYVVSVYALGVPAFECLGDAVAIAVSRDADGIARIVGPVIACGEGCGLRITEWVIRAQFAGATEFHIHRLANGPVEHADIVSDLVEDAASARARHDAAAAAFSAGR